MSEYSGLSFVELAHLPLSMFLLIRRDSWISSMMNGENGREFLKTLWRIQQTEPDMEAVERFRQRGGAVNGRAD